MDEARQQLQAFLCKPLWSYGTPQDRYPFIYEILQNYPSLASEEFGVESLFTEFDGQGMHCASLYPRQFEAAIEAGMDSWELHERWGEDYSILGQERLDTQRVRRDYPLLHLLAARAPLAIIQHVYEMYPAVIKHTCVQNLLHPALLYGSDSNVISFLISKNRQAVYEEDPQGKLPLDRAITYPSYWPHQDDDDDDDKNEQDLLATIGLLLDVYPQAITSRNREGKGPIHFCLQQSGKIPASVVDLLVEKMVDKRLKLELSTSLTTNLEALNLLRLVSLPQCIATDKKHLHLTLDRCRIRASLLHDLFAAMTSPFCSTLNLTDCTILLRPAQPTVPAPWARCQVKSVQLWECNMTPETYAWILRNLESLPHLTHLHLKSHWNKDVNITDSVMQLLATRRLASLNMDWCLLDRAKVARLFANDPTLTTYVRYSRLGVRASDALIDHYNAMNRHGRAKLSILSSTATKSTLIQCLLSVQRDSHRVVNVQSVLYGLLRVSPSLWSS